MHVVTFTKIRDQNLPLEELALNHTTSSSSLSDSPSLTVPLTTNPPTSPSATTQKKTLQNLKIIAAPLVIPFRQKPFPANHINSFMYNDATPLVNMNDLSLKSINKQSPRTNPIACCMCHPTCPLQKQRKQRHAHEKLENRF